MSTASASSENEIAHGLVVTFYSYKGGVGRSMALANVAALLAKRGLRVLVVDWDLEAPGLEKYFDDCVTERSSDAGVVDLIHAFKDGSEVAWRSCITTVQPFEDGVPVSILSAGVVNESYGTRMRSLDWNALFERHDLGAYLERLRAEWTAAYDFVLVDSRTGVTEIGGICTVNLPDVVVGMFTPNAQSLDGIRRVLDAARAAHAALPVDRARLLLVPVPARDESLKAAEQAGQWQKRIAAAMAGYYRDWLPRDVGPLDAVRILKIPYVPAWSFGERLPVVSEGTVDPTSIGFAFDLLTRLLFSRMDWKEVTTGLLSTGLAEKKSSEIAVELAEQKTVLVAEQSAKAELKAQLEVQSRRATSLQRLTAVTALAAAVSTLFVARGSLWSNPTLSERAVGTDGAPLGTASAAVSAMSVLSDAGPWSDAAAPRADACPDRGMVFVPWHDRDVDKSFCLDEAEVTASDYAECLVNREPSERCNPSYAENSNLDRFRRGDVGRGLHPLNSVSWDNAERYCQLKRKRLPTEAEWAYAASSGGRYEYPWGTSGDFVACKTGQGTCPVRSLPANPLGFYDLAGNVMEWVDDAFCAASAHGNCGRNEVRVVKGGSWDTTTLEGFAVAWRDGYQRGASNQRIGFRCAASVRRYGLP